MPINGVRSYQDATCDDGTVEKQELPIMEYRVRRDGLPASELCVSKPIHVVPVRCVPVSELIVLGIYESRPGRTLRRCIRSNMYSVSSYNYTV